MSNSCTVTVVPAQVALALTTYQLEHPSQEDHFAYNSYPGFSFGKTKPLFEDHRLHPLDCGNTLMDPSDNVRLKKCSCACMKTRAESFYDLFLAPSVKASAEYQQLLIERRKCRIEEESSGKQNISPDISEKANLIGKPTDSGVVIQTSSENFQDENSKLFRMSLHSNNSQHRRHSLESNDLSVKSIEEFNNDEYMKVTQETEVYDFATTTT